MICLSFDIEEFDAPREYGAPISLAQQLEISTRGTGLILEMLQGLGVKATFFCTANFATHRPNLIKRIVAEGHEIASHSYYHSKFEPGDLLKSKLKLEEITQTTIKGYRSPRMGEVDDRELLKAGYEYDSSLNPTMLPGRYNNLKEPRSIFRKEQGLIEIPSSVSTHCRVPLFWLSVHNLPLSLLQNMMSRAIKKDGYLNIYFHPWEFNEDICSSAYRMPFYIRRNSGQRMIYRLSSLIVYFKDRGHKFATLSELAAKGV